MAEMRIRPFLDRLVPWLTVLGMLVQLLSLHWRWLDRALQPAVAGGPTLRGTDYWCLPTAWVNLLAGKSAYDTWAHPLVTSVSTWYLAHPILAVALGSWLSLFPVSVGYWVWTGVSLGLLAMAARELAGLADHSAPARRWVYLLLLTSSATYLLLWAGNSHAILVLGFALAIRALVDLGHSVDAESVCRAHDRLMLGLLLSLFSKPLLLLALPGLILIPETRGTAARTLLIYVSVSAACILLPPLNPAAIGLREVVSLALDPAWVRDHMNIYLNHFRLNPYMRDNSIHWLNLVAQSGFVLGHVQIFSLAAFLAVAVGQPRLTWLPLVFLFATLALSLLVARLPEGAPRLNGAVLTLLLLGSSYFLAYPTVWEYQYTGALVVAAARLLRASWKLGASLIACSQSRIAAASSPTWISATQRLFSTKALSGSSRDALRKGESASPGLPSPSKRRPSWLGVSGPATGGANSR